MDAAGTVKLSNANHRQNDSGAAHLLGNGADMSNIKNYNRYSPNYSPYSAEMPARQPAAYGYKAAAKQPDAQEPTALYLPKTTWTWAFFITAVIQAVISLSLEW